MDKPVGTVDELRTWELERSLPHSQDAVWDAVTVREAMRGWSAYELVGTRSLGAPVTVARRDAGEPDEGSIVAFERPHLFAWTAGGRTLSWEMVATEDGGCTLRLVMVLDADATAPSGHAEWDATRQDLAAQLDALEAQLAGGAGVDGATRPYLAAREV